MKSKRSLFLLLICMMLLACIGVMAGCSSDSGEPDSPLVGTYELTHGIYEGVTIETAELGTTAAIEFKNNGKGEISLKDAERDAKSKIKYTLEGTKLTMEIEKQTETGIVSEDYKTLTCENFFDTGVDFVFTRK